MCAEIGFGNEAELCQNGVEALAALRGGSLGTLQGKFVDRLLTQEERPERAREGGAVWVWPRQRLWILPQSLAFRLHVGPLLELDRDSFSGAKRRRSLTLELGNDTI